MGSAPPPPPNSEATPGFPPIDQAALSLRRRSHPQCKTQLVWTGAILCDLDSCGTHRRTIGPVDERVSVKI